MGTNEKKTAEELETHASGLAAQLVDRNHLVASLREQAAKHSADLLEHLDTKRLDWLEENAADRWSAVIAHKRRNRVSLRKAIDAVRDSKS